MLDEPREITDDMLLSELTIGEFKALMRELLDQPETPQVEEPDEPKIQAKVTLRRKSLDEFMSDLGD